MAVKKITKRWLFNSFSVILVIVICLVIGVSVAGRSLYYNSVRQYVLSRANSVDVLLDTYSKDGSSEFSSRLRSLVEDFEYKDKLELMAINGNEEIAITSSGFSPDENMPMPDYESAKLSSDGIGEHIGVIGNERVLAITVMTDILGEDFTAMRYIVSLTKVDEQIVYIITLAVLLGLAILLLVIFSSSYFIGSIITPIGQVGQSAQKIAQGDFDVRLRVRNNDEIGDLCKAINNMAEELSVSEQIKNDFISSVSHELRTPLTAIRGWGETLMSDDKLDDDTRRKGMKVIMTETERLSSMVEELLDFSRMQSGRLKLEMEKLDILAELSDTILMFTERARKENKDLIYTESEELAVVSGDKNRLRQVFVNIIDNAIKYSDSGDSITVEAIIGKGSISIVISDTGVGISADDLPKVKTRFYKGKTTRRGSGIGLAVADEIVAMHGGTLELSSEKDRGTSVTITLPLVQ